MRHIIYNQIFFIFTQVHVRKLEYKSFVAVPVHRKHRPKDKEMCLNI